MKRSAILASLLLAACSGGSSSSQVTGGTLGTTHDVGTGSDHGHATAADPALAFRAQFANPGGMWMPQQMTLPGHVEAFKKLGVAIDPKKLADPLAAPLGAIVSLGGCSASFVSPDGLIVTNHHCVQAALAFNSSAQQDLVQTGFLAKTRADELPAGPSRRVYVPQAFTDVTSQMRDGLDQIKDPVARKEELEAREKKLVAACEQGKPGRRCEVNGFFRGGQYLQIEYLELRDLRVVYVPPRSVGNYGGEIDNWAWPRHTGDFSFYRAYVGKDGKPAPYAKDNVPYHPAHHLKVSTTGLAPSDFVMVVGFPGRTSRTDTASEVRHDVEWALPYRIAYYKERYAMLEGHLGDPGETRIKAGVAKQRIQNGLEKTEGVLKGLTKGDLLQRKDKLDKQIKDWAAQPGHEAHKAAIEKLEQLIADEQRTARVDYDRKVAFGGSKLLATALELARWAEERQKPDAARKPDYQDRDLQRAVDREKSFGKQYDRTLDRAGFRLALVRALQLPEADRPWLATLLGVSAKARIDEALIDKTLDAWYRGQQLEGEKLRIELLTKGTPAKLAKSRDPFVKAALRVWPIVKAEEKRTDARRGEYLLVAPAYADAMRQVLGGQLAPDANGTMRITYGTVRSFKPGSKDPADLPFTFASQIPAKNTGTSPFDAPQVVLDAIQAKAYGPYASAALGGELAVDFLSDVDTTNGNSGSATLNAKGELVGLLFDGTTEGLASDVVFDGTTTRSIHADVRYMLWMMDKIAGADDLLEEMGVPPKL